MRTSIYKDLQRSKIFKDLQKAIFSFSLVKIFSHKSFTLHLHSNFHNIHPKATKHEIFLESLCYSLAACLRLDDRGKCRKNGVPSGGTIDFRNIHVLTLFIRLNFCEPSFCERVMLRASDSSDRTRWSPGTSWL
jgi:hypothetical protein